MLPWLACTEPDEPDPRPGRHGSPDDTVETLPANPASVPPDISFDPAGGVYVGALDVSLTLSDGASAWYTTDDSLPTTKSTPYTAAIALRGGGRLRVLVQGANGLQIVASQSYVSVAPDLAEFDSNLPLVVVRSEGSLPSYGQESFTGVALQVHEPGEDGRTPLVGAATVDSRAAMQVRGSSTAGNAKASWAVELRAAGDDGDDDVALLGMPADSDWVLYAPYDFDRALIRNALMFQLSNDAGRYAPRTRFVEVFAVANGERMDSGDYQGVYTLMERIKRGPDRVDITALGPDDTRPPEVSGGYLFKRDRVGEDEDGFWAGGDGLSFVDPLIYVDPEEDVIEHQQADYLYTYIDDFWAALASGDPAWQDAIDLDSWVDNHILNLYPKNPDALRLSQYYYKDREGPIVAGPLWDFDRTSGCTSDDRAEDPTWWDPSNQTTDTTYMFEYGWYESLFNDPTFAAAYWARWDEMLDYPLSVEHVNGVIDEMAAELSEAAPRNYDRWPEVGPTTGSFEGEIAALEDWFDARHAWIASCLADHPDDPRTCEGD